MAKPTFLVMALLLAMTLGGCSHGGNGARAGLARRANVVRQSREQLLAQTQARKDAAQMQKDWNKFTKGIRNTLGMK